MRQIANLTDGRQATRFADYLYTLGISAQTDEENGQWSIWIRDEDQIPAARTALSEFQANPNAEKFAGVERVAEKRRREEQEKREAARKNIVPVGQKWGSPNASRRRPLTLAILFLCTGIGIMTNMGRERDNPIMQWLQFHRTDQPGGEWLSGAPSARLSEIRRGEIWRIVTPALLHFGEFHLVFNMIMFYQLGSVIENRIGTARLAGIMLAIAIPSNLMQALMPSAWGGSGLFGGLSGVVFGLLGYAWMKSRFDPTAGIYISRGSVLMALMFLGLGVAGAFNIGGVRIANWAHTVGFAAGVAVGYLSVWRRI